MSKMAWENEIVYLKTANVTRFFGSETEEILLQCEITKKLRWTEA